MRNHLPKLALIFTGFFLIFLLIRPESPLPPLSPADSESFTWDRTHLFETLELDFNHARAASFESTALDVEALEQKGNTLLAAIKKNTVATPFKELTELETIQFRLAARAAAHTPLLPRTQAFIKKVRITVMRAAVSWPVDDSAVHEAIYRVIYGGRTAIEEALAQTQSASLPSVVHLENIPSETPSVLIEGVTVHSGDIILSRGGAPTSALIARGNDFPGNFSHAALVHVDPETETPTVIESLIEKGVVLTTLDEFFEDKKLRILLLRVRPDHPAITDDPLAPHRAASDMLSRARQRAIPYDFAMNWNDDGAFFCSEVPYHAYRTLGIDLWAYKSTMSSPGLVAWLGSMGVRHFTTLVPSDLEYDPRLAVVAEWRNPEMLRQDRFDNVAMDALLEGAERGNRLGYPWYQLPLARTIKAWSILQEAVGVKPVIPNGITAPIALMVDALSKNVHPVIRRAVEDAASKSDISNDYHPPYWLLMDLARQALLEHQDELAPALTRPRTDTKPSSG